MHSVIAECFMVSLFRADFEWPPINYPMIYLRALQVTWWRSYFILIPFYSYSSNSASLIGNILLPLWPGEQTQQQHPRVETNVPINQIESKMLSRVPGQQQVKTVKLTTATVPADSSVRGGGPGVLSYSLRHLQAEGPTRSQWRKRTVHSTTSGMIIKQFHYVSVRFHGPFFFLDCCGCWWTLKVVQSWDTFCGRDI